MPTPEITQRLTELMEQERGGIYRLCLRCCGQADAAEDLVQETLVEAWRNRHKLVAPTLSPGWLYRIARNVCLRWRRARGQEGPMDELPETMSTPFPETLEQAEVGRLLDRAMATLPQETRQLLVGRYVEELPLAELAARQNTTEGTLAVRLHRGRQALQRVVTTHFHQDALTFGLVQPAQGARTTTNIWCPDCGSARLVFAPRPDAPAEQFRLVCPTCCTLPRSVYLFADLSTPEMKKVVEGVHGYRPILKRLDAAGTRWLNAGLNGARGAICDHCGNPASLRRVPAGQSAGPLHHSFHVVVSCPCGRTNFTTRLGRIHHGLPEVQRFWSRATRMRRLPDQRVRVEGVAAVLTQFASLTGAAMLDVLVRESDFTLLKVEENLSGS
jgi:RNA polymerase sigma factor (sigma-70 family)